MYRKPIGEGDETVALDEADDWYAAAGENGTVGFAYLWYDGPSDTEYHLGEDWNQNGDAFADDDEYAFAFGSGTVVKAEWIGGYGNTVIIDHGQTGDLTTSTFSLYGHLDTLEVSTGSIGIGEALGSIGLTGGYTDPHLHFEIFDAESYVTGIALSGGWVHIEEMEGADCVTFDATGKITSVVLGGIVGGTMQFSRYFSSDVFIETAGDRSRHYDHEGANWFSFVSSGNWRGHEIFGLDGNDFVRASRFDDLIGGGSGNDVIFGSAGTDTIYGGAGNDYLGGVIGDGDSVEGGRGNDYLYSRGEGDILRGGWTPLPHETDGFDGERDTFIFNPRSNGTATIMDFENGTDRIDVSKVVGDFGDVEIVSAGNGSDATVLAGDLTVIIRNVDAREIGAEDFIWG